MAQWPQPSLSGGELTPGLHGRVDLARYAVSVALLENFISKATGGAVKRPGTRYNGEVRDSSKPPRLIPFVYSTTIKYLLEVGAGYIRFWVPATPYGYALLRNGDGSVYEIVNGWAQADLPLLRYVQSADVLFFAGVNQADYSVAPKQLKRTGATTFVLEDFPFRRGPFRAMNANTALRMAVSAENGNVVVTCNTPIFTADMVGSFLYMEEQELNGVAPWTPLERNVPIGALRRSDGKIYQCSAVPTISGAGAFYICGNTMPLHEVGRAWDGPNDKRNDGVHDYWVGCEWLFLCWSFGTVKITGVVSATQVNALVIDRMPLSIKGVAGTPAGAWSFTGDGTTVTFPLTTPTNNTSGAEIDYEVTVDGVPVPTNPNSQPPSGPGGAGGGGDGSAGGDGKKPVGGGSPEGGMTP